MHGYPETFACHRGPGGFPGVTSLAQSSKVSKRSWVLQECLNRSTADYFTTRTLLEYGLTRTTFKELMDLGGEVRDFSELPLESDSSVEDNLEDVLKELAEMERLSPEQVSLCQYRHMLLCYLDRLSTYEVILQGPTSADKVFESKAYEVFRSENLVQSAVAFARDEDWGALEAMFTYHGNTLLPHRLAILFNFPETTPPRIYSSLLPGASTQGDSTMLGWEQKTHRAQDWVESDVVKKLCSLSDEASSNSGGFLYEENTEWEQYFLGAASADVVTMWYVTRATEIEEFSGQVDCALELLELGIERGVKGLAECHHELKTLSTLVYQCNADSRLSLKKFKALSDLEVVELMMKEEGLIVTEPDSRFAACLESWVLPFFERLEALRAGRSSGLLKKYLTHLCKGGLESCEKVLKQCTDAASSSGHNPIIEGMKERVDVTISCVYACDRSDQQQLDLAYRMTRSLKKSKIPCDVQSRDQLRELETYIRAAKIFLSYGMSKPIHFLKDMQGSSDEAQQLMVMLTRVASRRQPPMSKEAWQDLLEHLLSLRSTVFHFVDLVTCYKIYTESLLCSGTEFGIHLASQHLSLRPPPPPPHDGQDPELSSSGGGLGFKLSYGRSVELVVGAAKEYFNSAASLMDTDMDLARTCLDLFPSPAPEIQRELNLIASLSLLDDFHVTMLPVQVRLCENRLDIVRAVLDSSPTAYRKHGKIIHLCQLLGDEQGYGDSVGVPPSLVEKFRGQTALSQDQGHALVLTVLTALEKEDYKLALHLSSHLMQMHFAPAWEICRMMGLNDQVGDYHTRLRLLDFSITHCPAEEMTSLLQSKQLLQFKFLCSKCDVGGGYSQAGLGVASSRGSRGSLVGRSVQQLVSKGAGAVQQLMGSRTPETAVAKLPEGVLKPSEGTTLQGCLSSLNDMARIVDTAATAGGQTRKIGIHYHPFYLQEHKHPPFLYTDDVWEDLVDKQLFLQQAILRGMQLAIWSQADDTRQRVECRGELLKLADLWSQKDVLLTVCSLLACVNAVSLDEWISKVSSSKVSLELVIYCICLHLYMASTTPTAPPPYQYAPSLLINHMTRMVGRRGQDLAEWSDHQKPWVEYLAKYRQLLADHSQAEVLLKLGLGVDVDQFTQDDEYKHGIVLTLARSSDFRLFSTALSLARRHSIELWEVYITLLDSLLTTSNSSVTEIEKKIEERGIMKLLLENPQRSADYLRSTIFPELPGHKYGVMLLYYTLLQKFANGGAKFEEPVGISVHVKLLTKFKSAIHGFDYKLLMSGEADQDPLLLLVPSLSPNNIHVVAKLASKIPCAGGTTLTSGMVFCAFALKLFWKKRVVKGAEVEWLERYESCLEYLNLLTASELHHFILGTAVCQKSLSLPLDVRCQLIVRTINLCKEKQLSSKSPNRIGMSGDELVAVLEKYLQHLKNLSHPVLQEARANKGVQKLLEKFDLSLSQTEKVHSLALEMMAVGVPPEVVRTVLDLANSLHPHGFSAKILYKEALAESLAASATGARDLGVGHLEVILSSVSQHETKGGSVVTSNDLLTVLRPYCCDPSNPPSLRKTLFALMDKYLFLSKEDQKLLNFYRTQSVLANSFSVEVDLGDVSDPISQRKLFSSLLEKSHSGTELSTLCSLLDCWSDLSGSALVESWVDLLEATVNKKAPVELTVFIRAGLTDIPSLVDEKLFAFVCDASVTEAAKYSLLCDDEQMLEKAVKQLESDPSQYQHSADLMELLLYKKKALMLRQTTGGFLYNHMCAYIKSPSSPVALDNAFFARLLRCSEGEAAEVLQLADKSGRVKGVAKQLYDGGFLIDSGALLIASQSFHRELSTLNDALAYTIKQFT